MKKFGSARRYPALAAALTIVALCGATATAAFGEGVDYKVPTRGSATTNGLSLAEPTWTKLPTTSTSHPLTGDAWTNKPIGLARHGFVEEEFLVSGPARVYESVAGSNYRAEVINNSSYATNAIVRRPKHMREWSGTVIVEYMNATDGIDDQVTWGRLASQLFESRDIYVGFTGKANIIPILKKFDPTRYASVDMRNPVPAAEQKCGKLPGEEGFEPSLSKLYENGLLWDIWSEIALSLKSRNSPLGKTATEAYAVGESQSSVALMTYYRWFGGNRTVLKGQPLYDGYLAETEIHRKHSPGILNQCTEALPPSDVQRAEDVVPDRGVPYMAINSQYDFPPFPPEPSNNYRLWEVVGADHVDRQMYDHLYPIPSDLTKAGVTGPEAFPWFAGTTASEFSPAGWECDNASAPEVGMPEVVVMGYVWLKKWATNGSRPPVAPYVTRSEPGGAIEVDSDGNELGGLRLPYVQAPVAEYLGGLYGNCAAYHLPFTVQRLEQLYPTHDAYVQKVSAAARELVRRGFLAGEAGQEMIYAAEDRPIP